VLLLSYSLQFYLLQFQCIIQKDEIKSPNSMNDKCKMQNAKWNMQHESAFPSQPFPDRMQLHQRFDGGEVINIRMKDILFDLFQ